MVSQLFVGFPDAIAVLVEINGVDTAQVIAADGYTVNSRYIAAFTTAQRSQFTIYNLGNGSYLAVPH